MKRALRTSALAALFVGLFATPGFADEKRSGGSSEGAKGARLTGDARREAPLGTPTALAPEAAETTDRASGAGARTPLAQPGCTICLTGSASVQWNGDSGSFHVDTLSNNRSSGTSGALDLRIALTINAPVFGQSISYYSFSDSVGLGTLASGFFFSNINSGTIPFHGSQMPVGDYFMLLYLRENTGGSSFVYNDWIVFNNKVHCDGFSGCATIPAAPTANFSYSANPKAGQAVQFTDTSTGSPTAWSWNFGDSGTSTAQSPSHTYAAAGSYQVSLTASNGGGSNTNTQTVVVAAAGGGGTTCTEDALTACLIGGRYKVTGRWKNQFAGGAMANLNKTKLTDTTNAFWIADANTYEFVIRINTATDNGRAWITILTFTSVEFWVNVVDTKGTQQSHEYHSDPGNTTLIYDPSLFVYP